MAGYLPEKDDYTYKSFKSFRTNKVIHSEFVSSLDLEIQRKSQIKEVVIIVNNTGIRINDYNSKNVMST